MLYSTKLYRLVVVIAFVPAVVKENKAKHIVFSSLIIALTLINHYIEHYQPLQQLILVSLLLLIGLNNSCALFINLSHFLSLHFL